MLHLLSQIVNLYNYSARNLLSYDTLKMDAAMSSENLVSYQVTNGVTTQKTANRIFIAVKTSDFALVLLYIFLTSCIITRNLVLIN